MFEKNLEYIDNLALKRRLSRISIEQSRAGISYYITPSNDYILLKDDVPSDDLNNPREAIREMLKATIKNEMHSNDIIITFGIGLGYLLDETFNTYPSRIFVYEPDVNFLHFVLNNVDISQHLASGRVYITNDLDELLAKLNAEGVKFLSTGGTQKFIESLGYECQTVESVTTYPSILGGRVKTLHPKIFGGILGRRDNEGDREQMSQYEIPEIDLVIVDLYPFEQTVASGASEADIIEKIDIGGISLIRAGAKNFKDVVIVPSKAEYGVLLDILNKKGAETDIEDRRMFATRAFGVSSHYDTAIHNWFEGK